MSTEFVFDNKAKYIEGSLNGASNVSYILSSTFAERGNRMPEVTTVNSPHGSQGSIRWLDEILEIDGSKLSVEAIRFKEKGAGSLFARRWMYQQKQWRVKFEPDAKTWNVFLVVDSKPEEKPSVQFKLYQSKLIGKSVPASITFQSSVSDSDALFVLLVVLYSEGTEHRPTSFVSGLSSNIARGISFA